jgi:lysyl-tRNA synthetase, class II
VTALTQAMEAAGIEVPESERVSYARLADSLYKRTVRPKLQDPCFLVGHPAEMVPLAQRNAEDPTKLDMFQVVANGWELAKGYSELVDPDEQRARLLEQAGGDDEAMALEEDFIEAMEFGMAPMSGVGVGIDRLTSLLTDAPSVREVVLFPQMRPTAAPAEAPPDR